MREEHEEDLLDMPQEDGAISVVGDGIYLFLPENEFLYKPPQLFLRGVYLKALEDEEFYDEMVHLGAGMTTGDKVQ